MKIRCAISGFALLFAAVLFGGCQTDTTAPSDRVHGHAGMQVKSHDTMGYRPQPGT